MDKQVVRKSKPNHRMVIDAGQLLIPLLVMPYLVTARSWTLLTLGYEVLHELGLVREDREGDSVPTRRLLTTFCDAYYEHLANRL